MTEIKRYETVIGEVVKREDHTTIVAVKDDRIAELEAVNKSVTKHYLRVTDERNEALYKVTALQEQVRAPVAEKENARDVMLYAANNIAYGIFNLSDKKLSDLKRGLSDTTCPTDSAILAERELRSFAARIRSGEQP